MKKKVQTKNSRRELRSKKNRIRIFLFRMAIWVGILVLVCLLVLTIKSGITHVFFTSNPQFILRHIDVDVIKGIFTEDDIRNMIKFKVGETNLFDINPGDLRQQILADTLVQEIEIRHLLPDRLSLTVYGRTPVAQMISRGGKLVDSEAIILRPSQKSEIQKLPIITGVPGIKGYEIGQKLDNPLVLKAIRFLKLKEVIPNGSWLDIHLIQLNENYNEFRVYLNENKSCFIREGARLILPTENTKEALLRALSILGQRVQARQPTSSIDVTYQKRVPVRP